MMLKLSVELSVGLCNSLARFQPQVKTALYWAPTARVK
jgi:hypothetical protein